MTNSTNSLSRRGLDRMKGLHYFKIGRQVADLLGRCQHGQTRSAISKLVLECGYRQRFLYMLGRLPDAFSAREFRHWLNTVASHAVVLVAQLHSKADRLSLLRSLAARPLPVREVARRVGCLQRRRKPRSR